MNSGVTVQHDTDFNTDMKKKEKRSAEVLPPKRCQRSSRFILLRRLCSLPSASCERFRAGQSRRFRRACPVHTPCAFCSEVGPGGIAPLVAFRHISKTTVLQTACRDGTFCEKNGSDGTCTHLTLLARQHRPCGTCAPFSKGKMAGCEGIEPPKHEIWSLAAIPTRRQPAYKHFFPLPLMTAPANAIQKVEVPHTASTCTSRDSVSWPPGSKAHWQHAFSCFGFG